MAGNSGNFVSVEDQEQTHFTNRLFGGSFNSSGWTVATSGSRSNGAGGMPDWFWLAALGVGLLILIKRRKG